jgi:hypothetical protein
MFAGINDLIAKPFGNEFRCFGDPEIDGAGIIAVQVFQESMVFFNGEVPVICFSELLYHADIYWCMANT